MAWDVGDKFTADSLTGTVVGKETRLVSRYVSEAISYTVQVDGWSDTLALPVWMMNCMEKVV